MRHYVDMDIYMQAQQAAKEKIYSYRVHIGDVLWAVIERKNELLSKAMRAKSTNPGFNYGFMTDNAFVSTSDPEAFAAFLIRQFQEKGLMRRTKPGTRISADAETIASVDSKAKLIEYCIPKEKIYAHRLVELFTDTDDFGSKGYSEQTDLMEQFIELFKPFHIDIQEIIKRVGDFKPTHKQMLKEYLALSNESHAETTVDLSDIFYIQNELKNGSDISEIKEHYTSNLNPKERSVLAKHGVTPEAVAELMDKHERYTPKVAEELTKITGKTITYQQVDSFCRRHDIPLGRYYEGAVFCGMVILSKIKQWPNSKFRCRCTVCGEEKEFFQSTINAYQKSGRPLCPVCKRKNKETISK